MTKAATTGLTLTGVDVCVPGRTLVRGLCVTVGAGERLAILGRNGVGKTLTLMTLAGLRAPASGAVTVDGRPIDALARREIARRLTLVRQDAADAFPELALERVLLGRHPHLGRWQHETADDIATARRAMERLGIAALAERDVATLSGGERQRVALAQALAQAPDIYLLDEPTNHLDVLHQLQILEVFSALARDGAAVVMSVHDVNLAARFADRCLLLYGNGDWRLGAADEVLNESELGRLLAVPFHELAVPDGRRAFVAGGIDG